MPLAEVGLTADIEVDGGRIRVLVGDARARLADLPAASCRTCVTSPPYFGLRVYGADDAVDPAEIGQEPSIDGYVQSLVAVAREVRRVLTDDGTFWLNIGDTYASRGGPSTHGMSSRISRHARASQEARAKRIGRRVPHGAVPIKSLIGIPWRVALALIDDGWILRAEVIWSKANPLPDPTDDRPIRAHEQVFLFARSPEYYFDWRAIAEPAIHAGQRRSFGGAEALIESGRRPLSVWTIPTSSDRDGLKHTALMPETLAAKCILASSAIGDRVLDPFVGGGTTGVAALARGRRFYGVELYAHHARAAVDRILRRPLTLDRVVANTRDT